MSCSYILEMWLIAMNLVFCLPYLLFAAGPEFSRVKKFAVKGGAVVDPESGDLVSTV